MNKVLSQSGTNNDLLKAVNPLRLKLLAVHVAPLISPPAVGRGGENDPTGTEMSAPDAAGTVASSGVWQHLSVSICPSD